MKFKELKEHISTIEGYDDQDVLIYEYCTCRRSCNCSYVRLFKAEWSEDDPLFSYNEEERAMVLEINHSTDVC